MMFGRNLIRIFWEKLQRRILFLRQALLSCRGENPLKSQVYRLNWLCPVSRRCASGFCLSKRLLLCNKFCGDAMTRPFAHVRLDSNECWVTHDLSKHLETVAHLASLFATPFGGAEWAQLAGFWHDLGKFHPAWQAYLQRESGFDPEAHVEGQPGRPNHSTAGATLALMMGKLCPPSRILSYLIAGHHAGLPDWQPDDAGGDLCSRVFDQNGALKLDDLNVIRNIPAAASFLEKSIPNAPPLRIGSDHDLNKTKEHFHLWIRMLFSCLVDSDFLDTEEFMEPQRSQLRGQYLPIQELKARFDQYIQEKEDLSKKTTINGKRKQIREACIQKASCEPGFFSLTVPTGGGKTLSSMAFALEHAMRHGKGRIIVAIPYTSIIEQTAKILRYGTDVDQEIETNKKQGKWLFGEDQVIEHHSNIDPARENQRSRLACENWDAPIIVTTNVQLFESLFASRTSSCRKLHNIANSVVILDEVQMLPPEFLKPILSVLRGLVEHFGVTVVMMTATQPTLEGQLGAPPNVIAGIENVKHIIENPEELAKEFSRVELSIPANLHDTKQWSDLATELLAHEQVLCIVNSRKACRDLHALMPQGTIHLSALMCGEERSVVISEIKSALRRGEPIRVISTQLVEAGVDIDFPVVYRALAGFDSIAQAAGRCNRENRLAAEGKKGKVVVFVPPKPAPLGLLRKGEDASLEILRTCQVTELVPSIFKTYFERFYSVLNSVDKPRFQERLVRDADDFSFQFRTLAQDFQLIERNQQAIVVWYENALTGVKSHEWIELLRNNGPDRWITRKLQRFVVNVHLRIFNRMKELGFVEDVHGYWVQSTPGLYEPGIGLQLDESMWTSDTVI